MVKIVKRFEFLCAASENLQLPALLMKGRGSLLCIGPHPILKGFYKLALLNGKAQVDIAFQEIVDLGSNQNILPDLLAEQIEQLTADATARMTKKFLSL